MRRYERSTLACLLAATIQVTACTEPKPADVAEAGANSQQDAALISDVNEQSDASDVSTADVAQTTDAGATSEDSGSVPADVAPPDDSQPGLEDAEVDTIDPEDTPALDVGQQDAGTADINPEAIVCTGESPSFPAFSKSCTVDADCAVGLHQINCCGTLVAVGMSAADKVNFDAAEAVCQAQYPGCGCASMPTLAEDGLTSATDGSDLAARCAGGTCLSYVIGGKAECDAATGSSHKPFKWCQNQGDCTYVMHQIDCCGSQVALGITKAAAADFEKLEASCVSQIPPCKCLQKPTTAEDGASAGDGLIAVSCEAGLCMSWIKN